MYVAPITGVGSFSTAGVLTMFADVPMSELKELEAPGVDIADEGGVAETL